MKIAFGTDEATALTDAIVAKLKDLGHDVVVAADGIDWPDAGRAVGLAVANGEAEAGVVCCWTGTGVSIAANKVAGVRAALCTDAETARGARRWNDANVLAIGLRLTSPDVAGEMLEAFLSAGPDDGQQRLIDRVEPTARAAAAEPPPAEPADRPPVEPAEPVPAAAAEPPPAEPVPAAAAEPLPAEPVPASAAEPPPAEPAAPAAGAAARGASAATVIVDPASVPDDGCVRLTEWTTCGGCAAKWGAAPLTNLVRRLAAAGVAGLADPAGSAGRGGTGDASLLVGLAPFDDAAVYRVSDDLAVVSTTDFFPPLVDDPADFGAIAAANACSDVFAMGGRVVMALNIAAFPERLPVAAIEAVFAAAAATVAAAGGTVAGGHTIRSDEPIFGLAVQGLVHPDRVWTKSGARPGDVLVLSKPLGSGIVLAGAESEAKAATIETMRRLNRGAAEALAALRDDPEVAEDPHAVTDVTGYGLLGHGWEMAERSGAVVRFDASALPLYPGALAAAERGVRTGGDARNRAHLASHVMSTAPGAHEAIGYDPQTSGGLLAAVSPAAARRLVGDSDGYGYGYGQFVVVGDVLEGPARVELR